MPPDGGDGIPLLGGWITEDLQPATKNVAARKTRPVPAQLEGNLADCLRFIDSCLSMASMEARPGRSWRPGATGIPCFERETYTGVPLEFRHAPAPQTHLRTPVTIIRRQWSINSSSTPACLLVKYCQAYELKHLFRREELWFTTCHGIFAVPAGFFCTRSGTDRRALTVLCRCPTACAAARVRRRRPRRQPPVPCGCVR